MVAPCLGHQCMEAQYRCSPFHGTVTSKKGEGCPSDDDIINAVVKSLQDDAFEEEKCDPAKCICGGLPPWPKDWITLAVNVSYKGTWTDALCVAEVSLTYDWQCQQRFAPCFRKAPTGSLKK